MKILYVITSANIGGTEKALLELLKRLDRERFSPHICCLKKPGAYGEKFSAFSEGFCSLGLSESGGIKAIFSFIPALIKLIVHIYRIKPEVVHSFLFRANILSRFAARVARIPVVISSVRVIEKESWKYFFEKTTASLVTRYITVTNALKKEMAEKAGISEEKIITVYNGIDIAENIKTSLPERIQNIALIGRLHEQKGHTVLFKAMRRVLKHHPGTTVFLWGDGPEKKVIENYLQQEGLSENIQLKGVSDNADNMFSGIDMVVLPSLWEGFPNVLLEAMVYHKPVVASNIPGIDEIVVHGETGLMTPPGDETALADAILFMINNPVKAREMAMSGRKRVEMFSMDKTVKEIEGLYGRGGGGR